MKEMTKACLTGAIIAACLMAAWDAHAAGHTSANQGHHSGGNMGALGLGPGATSGMMGRPAASVGAQSAAMGSGQSGQGGSYGYWYLHTAPEDNYQPWPEAEMKQFQKP